MNSKAILIAVFCAATANCAAPLVKPPPLAFQSKIEHARDWQALADRSVDRFAATLHAEPPKVFVAPGPADMPFAAAYKRYVEQALLKHGYPVSQTATDAVVLSFDVQSYLYRGDHRKYPVEYASFWTTVGAIGVGLRNVSSIDTGVAAGFVAGPVIDALAALNDTTNAEVTLSVTVTDGSRLHYLDSETIYVEPSDLPLYWSQWPASAPQNMPSEGLSTVSLPVASAYR